MERLTPSQIIQNIRKANNMSQSDLAKRLGTQQPVISMIEHERPGKRLPLHLAQKLLRLAPDDSAEHEGLRLYIGTFSARPLPTVTITLPEPSKAPRCHSFLSLLSKCDGEEMQDMTDSEFIGWLKKHFITGA